MQPLGLVTAPPNGRKRQLDKPIRRLIMKLQDRIRLARESVELTQVELAERIGVRSQTVNQWEHGKKKPSRDNLIKLSSVTQTPLQWLVFGGVIPPIEGGTLRAQDAADTMPAQLSSGVSVPMYRVEDAVSGRPRLPIGSVPAKFPCSPEAFAFALEDDSNAPAYPSGAVWIVDPHAPMVPGRLVLAAVGAEPRAVCGRLSMETTASGRTLVVTPLNPAWPAARSDLEELEIIAVATEATQQL